MGNYFTTASIFLRFDEPEDALFLDLSFGVAKNSFVVANLFALAKRSKKTTADQQLPFHLISSITLLDFPSNIAKHKQMGD